MTTVVFRFRGRSNPVKLDKHEITWSNLAQDASSIQTITLAKGVPVGDKDASTECAVGSHVKRIYLEFHFAAEEITVAKVIHWEIISIPTGLTVGSPATYYNASRARIFQRGMEMLPKDVSTVYKRIISVKVPKIYQRMTENSNLVFRYVSTSTTTINACGIAIYKEIY